MGSTTSLNSSAFGHIPHPGADCELGSENSYYCEHINLHLSSRAPLPAQGPELMTKAQSRAEQSKANCTQEAESLYYLGILGPQWGLHTVPHSVFPMCFWATLLSMLGKRLLVPLNHTHTYPGPEEKSGYKCRTTAQKRRS